MKIFFILFLSYELLFSIYFRDINTDTILNTNALLMWQDSSDNKTLDKSWVDAIDYCENLNFAGFDDWRLPNINELNSIANVDTHSPAINSVFVNIDAYSGGYWSSTTYINDTAQSWYVDFIYGDIKTKIKTNNLKVRCIRSFN